MCVGACVAFAVRFPSYRKWICGIRSLHASASDKALWGCSCNNSKDQKRKNPLIVVSFQKDTETENSFS